MSHTILTLLTKLFVMEVLYIVLKISVIIPPDIAVMMLFLMMVFSECLQLVEDVDLCIKIPSTLPFPIVYYRLPSQIMLKYLVFLLL